MTLSNLECSDVRFQLHIEIIAVGEKTIERLVRKGYFRLG